MSGCSIFVAYQFVEKLFYAVILSEAKDLLLFENVGDEQILRLRSE